MDRRCADRVKRGFGLLEVVISVAIIVMVVVGVIGLNLASMKMMVYAGQKIQAYHLVGQAQEILKYLKNCTPSCESKNWTDFLQSLGFTGPADENPRTGFLQYDETGGSWSFQQGTDPETISINRTEFKREITILTESPTGTDKTKYRKIIVRIKWGSPEKEVQGQTYLTEAGD